MLHLLSDQGFAAKTVGWFVSYVILVSGLAANDATRKLLVDIFEELKLQELLTSDPLAWWSLLGLLSSSCCLIQILLSMVSLGCCRLNSWLGPLRPALIGATCLAISITWSVTFSEPFQWPLAAATTAIASFLTFTPEIYTWYQAYQSKTKAAKKSLKTLTKNTAQSEVVIELQKGALDCIICVSKVRSVLMALDTVCGVPEVNLEEALVTARLFATPSDTNTYQTVVKKLADANFPTTLKQVRLINGSTEQGGSLGNGMSCCKSSAAGHMHKKEGASETWLWVQCVAGGLAGSSCCILQLAINAFTSLELIQGVGCVGLNKVLGPIRTPVRVVTAALILYAYRSGRQTRTFFAAAAIFLTLTFMPELLVLAGGPVLAPPTHDTMVLTLHVGGMGCEACQLHVQGVLDRAPGVIASTVSFRTGLAEVVVARNWVGSPTGGFDLRLVSEKLDKNGFSIALATSTEGVLDETRDNRSGKNNG